MTEELKYDDSGITAICKCMNDLVFGLRFVALTPSEEDKRNRVVRMQAILETTTIAINIPLEDK